MVAKAVLLILTPSKRKLFERFVYGIGSNSFFSHPSPSPLILLPSPPPPPAYQVQFSVVAETADSFTFRVDLNSTLTVNLDMARIRVENIEPKNNVIETSIYQLKANMPMGCLRGLTANTLYNICLSLDFINGFQEQDMICFQKRTTSTSSISSESCLSSSSTTQKKVEGNVSSKLRGFVGHLFGE